MSHTHRSGMPTIPDLRFEQTYLRSISAHLHVRPLHAVSSPHTGLEYEKTPRNRKGKDVELVVRASELSKDTQSIYPIALHAVRINWPGVAWVTARDQLLSPLLQGALW